MANNLLYITKILKKRCSHLFAAVIWWLCPGIRQCLTNWLRGLLYFCFQSTESWADECAKLHAL